jgi:hypothetical protein
VNVRAARVQSLLIKATRGGSFLWSCCYTFNLSVSSVSISRPACVPSPLCSIALEIALLMLIALEIALLMPLPTLG